MHLLAILTCASSYALTKISDGILQPTVAIDMPMKPKVIKICTGKKIEFVWF